MCFCRKKRKSFLVNLNQKFAGKHSLHKKQNSLFKMKLEQLQNEVDQLQNEGDQLQTSIFEKPKKNATNVGY